MREVIHRKIYKMVCQICDHLYWHKAGIKYKHYSRLDANSGRLFLCYNAGTILKCSSMQQTLTETQTTLFPLEVIKQTCRNVYFILSTERILIDQQLMSFSVS